ncbi:hypothetical protein QGM71_04175 [Virgibacillus sp. C22-A2]|uniref:Magnesium transporter MgtE intracellular domain-containing protein n=1 Tax=Virgibacillus tibetensis TaxID=3042313 RepID=A0ABU6KBI1_9BACI|nr:hypothetical protein [Virgibacillus sp. C22-A2]
MVNKIKNEKKKTNPFLWFLFAIVIPGVIAITLAVIIFTLAGVDIGDWVKKKGSDIPVISSIISAPEEESVQRDDERVQNTIDNKDEEIQELNQEVSDMKATIEALELEIVKLERNATEIDDNQDENLQGSDKVKSISSSFKDMDNEQAALIIQNLDNDTALAILSELSNKVRGEILEAMNTEAAAELTRLFINSDN